MRPRALTLIALLVTLALPLAGCGEDEGSGADSAEARALLGKAFENPPRSGNLRVDVEARLRGVERLDGPITVSLDGPYESNGEGKLPSLDWDVSVQAAGLRFKGGVVVTDDNAFIEFGGRTYEVGTQLFASLSKRFSNGGGVGSLKGLGLDPASWLQDPQLDEGDDVGGDATRKVSGSVNVKAAIEDVVDALRSPAFRQQLESRGGVTPKVPELDDDGLDKVEDAVQKLDFEVNVDDDNMLRRALVEAEFDMPEGIPGGLEGGEVKLEVVLDEVGTDPEIRAPANALPLSLLLGRFGLGRGLAVPQ